ncbi:acyltransferase domain-containing protein [Paenibacillus mesotrionivorans]|uniref:Acyltransferase domain-containing protein n=1 Tax=Paenibacillus mesotrionivorans TaxID=3160968 RepID=A0ACC7NTQ5_9BACL
MTGLARYITDRGLLAGMERVARKTADCGWLAALAEELLDLLYGEGGEPQFWAMYTRRRAELEQALGEDADCYLAYVYGLGFPRLAAIYRDRGYPRQVLADTLCDFDLRAKNYRELHGGRAGIDDYRWLTRHMTATVFRLGRLQFVYSKPFVYGSRIYRKLRDGSLTAVAEAGLAVDGQGFVAAEGEFVTELREAVDGTVTANLIGPGGNILTGKVSLPAGDYACVVRDGEPVIDIHIPADGSRMSPQDAALSMRMAWAFAQRYFPETRYRGFVCSSWLLSTEVEEILPEDANLVRFSRLFTRCAGQKREHELIYSWIFGMGKNKKDFRLHEPSTTMQKGARRLLEEGRWFTSRNGFIPADRITDS